MAHYSKEMKEPVIQKREDQRQYADRTMPASQLTEIEQIS